MLKVVKLLHILILIDYPYSLHRELQRVGLLNEFSCEAKCLCQMDFYIAMFICARGRTVAYSRIPQQQKRKNKQRTFVLYMPLLILNIFFYLKYSLFYEKKSQFVYILVFSFRDFMAILLFWKSPDCTWTSTKPQWGKGYLQMQCFQRLFADAVFSATLCLLLAGFCVCAVKSSWSE